LEKHHRTIVLELLVLTNVIGGTNSLSNLDLRNETPTTNVTLSTKHFYPGEITKLVLAHGKGVTFLHKSPNIDRQT